MSTLYGDNIFIKDNLVNKVTDSMINFGSLAYNEYLNYRSMLENCTDDSNRSILEAKVEVLQEIGIKDIWEKIKEAFRKLAQIIKDLFNKIKSFFKTKKVKNLEKEISDLKSKLKEKEKETQEAASKASSSEEEILTTKKAFDELMSKYESLNKSATEKLQAERDRTKWFNDKYDDIKHKYVNLDKENKTNLDRINLANLKLAKALVELASNPVIYFNVFDYTEGNSPYVYHIGKAMESIRSTIQHTRRYMRDKSYDNDEKYDFEYKIKSSLSNDEKELLNDTIEKLRELSSGILSKDVVNTCKNSKGNFGIGNLPVYIEDKQNRICDEKCKEFSHDAAKFLSYLESMKYASQASMMEHTLSDLHKSTEEITRIVSGLSSNADEITTEAVKALTALRDTFYDNIKICEVLCSHATRCYGALGSSIFAVKALMATE